MAGGLCGMNRVCEQIVLAAGKNPTEELGGGHSSYVRAHARAYLLAGIRPHLFCIGRHNEVRETDFGVVHSVRSPFHWLQRSSETTFRTPWIPLHAPLVATAIVRFMRHNPAIDLAHGFGLWGAVLMGVKQHLARDRRRIITITSVYTTVRHEFAAKRRSWSPIQGARARLQAILEDEWVRLSLEPAERRWLAESDWLLVNYHSVRRLIAGICPQRQDVRMMPYTPETAFTQDTSKEIALPPALDRMNPVQVPLVMAVSRHDPRKGIDVLLRALAHLHRDGVPFHAHLIGGGSLLGVHRRFATALGLDGCVDVVGFVPDAYACLRAADIFVLPSLEEGSGSVSVLEAMQAGCAIVASDIDGIPEDLTHEADGLLVPAGDAAALAGQLARVLRDPELRVRLQQSARATYDRCFTPQRLAESLRVLCQVARQCLIT